MKLRIQILRIKKFITNFQRKIKELLLADWKKYFPNLGVNYNNFSHSNSKTILSPLIRIIVFTIRFSSILLKSCWIERFFQCVWYYPEYSRSVLILSFLYWILQTECSLPTLYPECCEPMWRHPRWRSIFQSRWCWHV